MAQSYMVRLESPNGESEEVDLFELDLAALFEQDDVLISDHPSSTVTPAEALSFMRIIEGFAQVASPSLFDEFMEDTSVREVLNNGDVAYWTDAEEFAESELLGLMGVDFDDQMGRVLYRNINFESLAQDIVDTADSGDEYLYDDGVWVRRAGY